MARWRWRRQSSTCKADNYSALRERYGELRDAFRSPYPGYIVPTFVGTTVDGTRITVGERLDGPQLLFVFNTADESPGPHWRTLATALAEEHPGLQVVGIGVDGNGTTDEGAVDNELDFPVTSFPTPKLARLYRVGSTPLVLYLDRQGEVQYSRTGDLRDPIAIDSVTVAVRDLANRDVPAQTPVRTWTREELDAMQPIEPPERHPSDSQAVCSVPQAKGR